MAGPRKSGGGSAGGKRRKSASAVEMAEDVPTDSVDDCALRPPPFSAAFFLVSLMVAIR